jgi:methionine-S-sulfoxide reductase
MAFYRLSMRNSMERATFAGGCFWCLQYDLDSLPGVVSTDCGYAGGSSINPTYEEVCSGTTGHVEAVQIYFDPQKITFDALLTFFWEHIDPTKRDGQFSDNGSQYQPMIFYHNEEQRKAAEHSKQKLEKARKDLPIRVEIHPLSSFYKAEEYHQKFSEKNPLRYYSYHAACGRKERLKELWG